MSIWGSLIGGMVGFSLGGPFGMLIRFTDWWKISKARASTAGGFGASSTRTKKFLHYH